MKGKYQANGPLPAAADKMDNLQTVPFRQAGLGPFCAGNNITVMLDGYPVAFEVKFRDQVLEVGSRRQLRKFTRLAVEDEMHRGRVSSHPSIAVSAHDFSRAVKARERLGL